MYQAIDFGLWGSWNYQEYICSDWWRARSAEYKQKAGNRCEVPDCVIFGKVECHHKNYLRLGRELDSDLICVCRKHHEEMRGK